jgi:PAS domain-containing protein
MGQPEPTPSPSDDGLRPQSVGYLIAVLGTAAVALLRLAFANDLGGAAAAIPFVVPVVLAAWCGGLWPGLVATALGAVALDYLYLPPHYSLLIEGPGEAVAFGLFLVIGATLSAGSESLHRARRRTLLAEAAKWESEDRFRAFVDHSPSRAWLKDEDGRYAFVSRSVLTAYRLAQANILGRTDHDVFPAPLADRYRQGDRDVLAADGVAAFTEPSA